MTQNSEVMIITLLKRKPGMSREDFIRYYETRHAVLATQLVPGLQDYRRIYLDPREPAFGMPCESPGFDVITMLVFADEAAYLKAAETLAMPEIARQIAEDEEQLFDRSCIRPYFVEQRRSKLSST